MSNNDLAIRFFLQLAFIVATCRIVGLLAKRVGQPQVVAEMIAGVLMGPSLFGLLLPGIQAQLFPKASMSIIYAVSQVGLVLYMFLIGLEFQVDLIKQRLRSAATVSVAGILLPFALVAIVIFAIGGGVLYALVVLLVGKPLLRRLGTRAEGNGGVSGRMLAFVLMLLMICAWYTDAIRLYAVFGAFILGTAMPRGVFARDVQRLLEPLTTNFLLPLFFVYSGLNTSIGLVNSKAMWIVAFFILVAACCGKGIACWLAARLNGESNRDAMAIGTLMNARGLMELIILNIGLERGIITPTLFTIMVIMAIATTLMASPVFEFVYRRQQKRVASVVLEPVISGMRSPEFNG